MHALIPTEIAAQVWRVRTLLEQQLAENLKAIHLFGSALDGGLKPHSDVDLLVAVGSPLADSARTSLMTELLSASAPPGADGSLRPLEVTLVVRHDVVPWRYPPRRELQFGEWLRDDLQAGIVEPATPDPDLAILLTKARQHSVVLAGPSAFDLYDPVPAADFNRALADTVAQWNSDEDWQGDERNVVLALARIWFSATTGDIAPKHVAAEWLLARLPPEHRPVVEVARAAYLGSAGDDLAKHPRQTAAFVRYARGAIERLLSA